MLSKQVRCFIRSYNTFINRSLGASTVKISFQRNVLNLTYELSSGVLIGPSVLSVDSPFVVLVASLSLVLMASDFFHSPSADTSSSG